MGVTVCFPMVHMLDPHITLDNALYQLDRVADAWAKDTKRDPAQIRHEIEGVLEQKAFAVGSGSSRRSWSMCWK